MTPMRELDCLAGPGTAGLLHAIRPAGLQDFLAGLPAAQAAHLAACGFSAAAGVAPVLLPGGAPAAVIGLGEQRGHLAFGDLAFGLPQGDWALADGDFEPQDAVLGWCLGAYRFTRFRGRADRGPARLWPPAACERAVQEAQACWMVRDLINTPANHLGPAELADAARQLALTHGATFQLIEGAALEEGYPALAAVGAGSPRAPCVAELRWHGAGPGGDETRLPLVSLCGKGVVFDTGGLDLKPSAAMLRMKKDMGGAAILLGVAALAMRWRLRLRLVLRLGCVENAVSGQAMRPGDVLATRAGHSVEIGNTDAEGRLVLADLLAAACEEQPDLLIDVATLTGAARVALGPDLPALFSPHDALADALAAEGMRRCDPMWRLPLWDGYADWLASGVADCNNVSSKPFAGAIVAALFLRRFVTPSVPWAHVDAYAWNDGARPARPEGGEAQAMRAIAGFVANVADNSQIVSIK